MEYYIIYAAFAFMAAILIATFIIELFEDKDEGDTYR